MCDGNFQDLAFLRGVCERRIRLLHADVHVAADEAQAGVAHHRARQHACFAENLEAIADAKYQSTAVGKLFYGIHHGGKARDRTGAEIVAIGKSAGQDDGVAICQVFRLVPDELDRFLEDVSDGVKRVVLAIGPGKNNDSKFHLAAAPCRIAGICILAQPQVTSTCRRARKAAQASLKRAWAAVAQRRRDREHSRHWSSKERYILYSAPEYC